jgi:hypothetical protein
MSFEYKYILFLFNLDAQELALPYLTYLFGVPHNIYNETIFYKEMV